jgi:leucyl-tRNA synthetase
VIAGACERCGTMVEQRLLSQWFFRITEYAERLLNNLSWIDWSETTKKAQENWIGRSEGAEIRFRVSSPWEVPAYSEAKSAMQQRMAEHGFEFEEMSEEERTQTAFVQELFIPVFTTRPDTIFGATFMVLAPEHELVD